MKLQGRPTLTRALHKSDRKLYVEMNFAIVKGEADRKSSRQNRAFQEFVMADHDKK